MSTRNRFSGCASIPDLFALAFEHALDHLAGVDIAALQRAKVGAVGPLGWPTSVQAIAEASALLDALSQREQKARYRLRDPERRELLAKLGAGSLEDGRRMFLLALAIDEHFAEYAEDQPPGSPVVVPMPSQFFTETMNPPPPLGQMTPIAVCRRWLRRFWYVGRTDGLTSLGRLPTPMSCQLDSRTLQMLQSARDAEDLRVALVTWRRHGPADLKKRATPPGCFAVDGLVRPARAGLLNDLVDQLNEHRIHVALLPELALDADELARLRDRLREKARRFPVLTVAGLTHRPVESGKSHVNEAVVLNARGEELLRHEKLEPFSTHDPYLEDILPRQSATYAFLDTPIGRIVLNICRDFRSDVPMLMNRILGATLVLVPAYSKRLDFALEEARILGARQSAMVFALNPLCDSDLRDATAVYVPVRGKGGEALRCQADVLPLGGDVVVQICQIGFKAERNAFLDAGTLLVV